MKLSIFIATSAIVIYTAGFGAAWNVRRLDKPFKRNPIILGAGVGKRSLTTAEVELKRNPILLGAASGKRKRNPVIMSGALGKRSLAVIEDALKRDLMWIAAGQRKRNPIIIAGGIGKRIPASGDGVIQQNLALIGDMVAKRGRRFSTGSAGRKRASGELGLLTKRAAARMNKRQPWMGSVGKRGSTNKDTMAIMKKNPILIIAAGGAGRKRSFEVPARRQLPLPFIQYSR